MRFRIPLPRSLRTRVAAAMFIVALVPTLTLSWINYTTAQDAMRAAALGSLRAMSWRAAADLDAFVDHNLADVRTQAQLDVVWSFAEAAPAQQTRMRATVARALAGFRSADDRHIDAYAIVDADGRLLVDDKGRASGERWVLDEAPLVQRTGLPAMSDVQEPRGGAAPVVEFAAPIRGGGARTSSGALLVVRYNASVLQSILLRQLGAREAAITSWVDDSMHVRLAGDTEATPLLTTRMPLAKALRDSLVRTGRLRLTPATLELKRVVATPQSFADSTAFYEIHETYGGDSSRTVLGATAKLRARGWKTYYAQPASVALAPARRLLIEAAAIALAMALGAWLLSAIVSQRLAEPLSELAEQARRIAEGHYDARVRERSTEEVARLGASFNNLAERIGNLVNSLAERTRELEADIEERKRLENELLHARQLEAVGRLAGGVAHDFNNLLTVVLANLTFLEEGLPPDSPLFAEIRSAQSAAARGAALTSQLLAFSRRGTIEVSIIDLGVAMRDMGMLLQRLIGDEVELTVEPDAGLWPVSMDPTQCNQVIMNLASNARDAMPKGGALTISAHNVEAETAEFGLPPGEYVELSVRDTGEGMSADTIAHAFEPFFTTKAIGRGTGLGLATVYGIVTRANGSIRIESTPGDGTTFFVRLPRAAAAAAPTARVERRSGSRRLRGTETILLVEDNELVRASTARSLRELGYVVMEAGDGLDALNQLAAHQGTVHLIVSDILMPHLDGATMARRVRETHPWLPVLLLSGNAPDEVVDLLRSGEFLAKPFGNDELALRVRHLLDRGRRL